MSSIMRVRSALTGRWEGWEVIGGSSLKPKVAGPSMLGIGCPDRHALPLTIHRKRTDRDAHPSRESGFVPGSRAAVAGRLTLQPVYPQLRKYPCATAVTLGAKSRSTWPR